QPQHRLSLRPLARGARRPVVIATRTPAARRGGTPWRRRSGSVARRSRTPYARRAGGHGMKLYSGPLSMFGAKAEIAALEKGLDVDREFVPFALATLYDPKHPVVARVNPKQQVPVLVDGDLELFDSTQLFEFFEDVKPHAPLWPRCVRV